MAFFLGLDTGTSGTKALVIDETGALAASDTQEYGLSTPHPQWAEQDPEMWWQAAQKAIAAVLQKANLSGDDITGVGLTGQMHGSVFLNKKQNVLRPALLWCDSRTGAECDEITRKIGGREKLFAVIGQPILASFTAPKIVWVKNHEPQIYEKIAHVLLPKDFIRLRLTGEFAAEVSDASGTSLLDVRKRDWSQPMLDALQIPREWLPKVYESPEVTGIISEAAAKRTGLRAGTPVVGGAGDQAAAGVGCGIVTRGRVSESLGTSGVVFAHSDEAFFDPEMRIQTFCHAVPGAWHMMGCVLSAGGSLRWYRDTFANGTPYDVLTEAAQNAPAGCEGLQFLPYLTGERTPYPDPNARGVFFGATLRSEAHWFVRAVLEGVGFGLKDSFTLLDALHVPVSEVRTNGGGAKSAVWRQILTDIIGHKHVTLEVDEGPAFGAALLAAVGTGTFASVAEACEATIRPSDETLPKPENVAAYEKYYGLYRTLYPALQTAFGEAARLSAG